MVLVDGGHTSGATAGGYTAPLLRAGADLVIILYWSRVAGAGR